MPPSLGLALLFGLLLASGVLFCAGPARVNGRRLVSRSGSRRREPRIIPRARRSLIPCKVTKPIISAPANSNMLLSRFAARAGLVRLRQTFARQRQCGRATGEPTHAVVPPHRLMPIEETWSVPPQSCAVAVDALDVLDAKLLGPPRQEFVELHLGGPDNFVLQHLYQPVD